MIPMAGGGDSRHSNPTLLSSRSPWNSCCGIGGFSHQSKLISHSQSGSDDFEDDDFEDDFSDDFLRGDADAESRDISVHISTADGSNESKKKSKKRGKSLLSWLQYILLAIVTWGRLFIVLVISSCIWISVKKDENRKRDHQRKDGKPVKNSEIKGRLRIPKVKSPEKMRISTAGSSRTLVGEWTLDAKGSQSFEPILTKFGVPWTLRKAAIAFHSTMSIEATKSHVTVVTRAIKTDESCMALDGTVLEKPMITAATIPGIIQSKVRSYDGKRLEVFQDIGPGFSEVEDTITLESDGDAFVRVFKMGDVVVRRRFVRTQ